MNIKFVNKKRFIACIVLIFVLIALSSVVVFATLQEKQTVLTASNVDDETIKLYIYDKYEELNYKDVDVAYGSLKTDNTSKNETKKTDAESNKTVTKDNKSTNVKTNTAKRGLPILMYHFFYNAKAGEKGADNNWMEISAFEQQMKYLADNNFYFPSWDEVESYIDGKKSLPEKSVVITIDDGDETFIKLAIPIIKKYNVKATSFVVTSWNGDWLPKQYKSNKLDFQSHSHDMHRPGANGKGRFVNLSYKEALEDVKKSKNIIGNCTVFCYPFGHYNDTAVKVLKDAGYRLAVTTNGGRVYPGQNKYQLPRVRISKGISMSAFKDAVK